jgi:hypothetical protein
MNNKTMTPGRIAFAALAAGILMGQAAWAAFDSAAVPTDTDLKVLRVVPEGDQVPITGRQIVRTHPSALRRRSTVNGTGSTRARLRAN